MPGSPGSPGSTSTSSSTTARGYGSSSSHRSIRIRPLPWLITSIRPSSNPATSVSRATVPTSTR